MNGDGAWYAAGVVLGAVLIVATAIRQPYSYDELTQITPYDSDTIGGITGATRQPPLDPLLGAMFQRLFGIGQFQQRLVPVLAGIATLIVVALLLHRMRLGRAGAFGVLVLATAPLMVRYSAYTRPYALTLFFMVLFVLAAHQWLDRRKLLWLGVALVAAAALPFSRVPEPTAFLATTPVILAWLTIRRRYSWPQTLPLIAISAGALFFVAIPLYRTLASEADAFYDASPSGFVDRFGGGVEEIVIFTGPMLASWLTWWPITVLLIIAALVLREPRRWLFGSPFWLPLLAAPIAFLLGYHFLNPWSFEAIPYRARSAYFFLPAYILIIVALAYVALNGKAVSSRLKVALTVLLGAALLGQLPATADVVLHNAAPDFDDISSVLTEDLPDDAIVLYDRPTPVPQSRQPFQGVPRYMGDTPYVETAARLATNTERRDALPTQGPVYVLINGQCASPGRCEPDRSPWEEDIPGWKLIAKVERFTLYEPTDGQEGHAGAVAALTALADALGPEMGYYLSYSAAEVLRQDGHTAAAHAVIRKMYAQTTPDLAQEIRDMAEQEELDPFD